MSCSYKHQHWNIEKIVPMHVSTSLAMAFRGKANIMVDMRRIIVSPSSS